MSRTPEALRKAIEQRTQPGANGCLIWTGAIDSDGYPKITNGRTANGYVRIVPTHRVNWELTNGPIPDGQELARIPECPNRRCIEPTHLRLLREGDAGRAGRDVPDMFRCGHSHAEYGRVRADGKLECHPCSLERSRERCRRWRARHPDKIRDYNENHRPPRRKLNAA